MTLSHLQVLRQTRLLVIFCSQFLVWVGMGSWVNNICWGLANLTGPSGICSFVTGPKLTLVLIFILKINQQLLFLTALFMQLQPILTTSLIL